MSFWICTEEKPLTTHFYYFTQNFDLPSDPADISSARLSICADSRYRLYINGKFAGEGPCQGSEYTRYYETFETAALKPLFLKGYYEICVEVLYLQENSFISIFRGSRPALWIDGEIAYNGDGAEQEKFCFGTDASWSCVREDNVTFRHFPGIHISTPPGEEVWGDPKLAEVNIVQLAPPQPRGFTVFGLADNYLLEPRPIPQLEYGSPEQFKIARRGDNFLEIDAGTYTTALPTISAAGAPGSVIKIIYSESYVTKDAAGNRFKGMRDAVYTDPSAEFGGMVFDVIHIPDSGTITYTPFWYRAFRFIRLEFSDPSVHFDSLTYSSCFYPFPLEGSFESTDRALNEMWKVSINTVKCCAHEIFIDCPYFEQQQYDMDSCLEMLFTLRMIDDFRLPFKSITDLSRSQIYNGMLQANYPSIMTQIIPNFTLFWVLMLREYVRYAPFGDETRRQASELLGTMDKALESFEIFRDETGLMGATPYWSFVDWVPGWPGGVTPGGMEGEPLTVASMLFVAALRCASEVAGYCGRAARSAEYAQRADELSALIIEKCWDNDAKLFRNTPSRREFSEHTSLWAVLSGIVNGAEATELMERTMNGDIPVAHCSFSMGFFLFRALEKAALYDKYAPRLFGGWQRMLDNHCTTWCENPDSPRSECHGWSSAPAYEFSAMILGAYPEEDGYRTLRVKPHMFVLNTEKASGSVPTPFGSVKISLSRNAGTPGTRTYSIDITFPDGSSFAKENCADGEEFRFKLDKA